MGKVPRKLVAHSTIAHSLRKTAHIVRKDRKKPRRHSASARTSPRSRRTTPLTPLATPLQIEHSGLKDRRDGGTQSRECARGFGVKAHHSGQGRGSLQTYSPRVGWRPSCDEHGRLGVDAHLGPFGLQDLATQLVARLLPAFKVNRFRHSRSSKCSGK